MSYRTTKNHSYKGYTYCPEEDFEPDNIKIFHTVVHDETNVEIGWIPLSPYGFAKEETFRAWVDSGFPNREKINKDMGKSNVCNPSEEDIVNYYIERILVK